MPGLHIMFGDHYLFFWAELSVIPTARAKDPSVFGKAPREEKMGHRKKVLNDSLIADGWHVSS